MKNRLNTPSHSIVIAILAIMVLAAYFAATKKSEVPDPTRSVSSAAPQETAGSGQQHVAASAPAPNSASQAVAGSQGLNTPASTVPSTGASSEMTSPGTNPARVPKGEWASRVPAIEEYAAALPAVHQPSLAAFRRQFPDLDPTEKQQFAEAQLRQRSTYGTAPLTEKQGTELTAWLMPMEKMQAELVVARGRHIGIAISGSEPLGINGTTRSFTLIGFEGVKPVYSMTQNADASESTGVNLVRINAAFDSYLADTINGTGLYVNVNDHGTIYEHAEFQLPSSGGSRILLKESNDGGDRGHMTHVAGTVAAYGYNAALTGMAPRVWIRSHIQQYTYDITGYGAQWPGQPLDGTTTNPRNSELQKRSVMGTTSLGSTDENTSRGVYTYSSSSFDTALWDYPYYTHFYAASNDGGSYATLGTDNPIAKNVITIGSVSDTVRDDSGNYTSGGNISGFSSRGPTYDGRIKPDLTANGDGVTSCGTGDGSTSTASKSGTSMATPNASGSTTLLIDYISEKLPGHYFRSSTLKALLINTATDRGNTGPDYNYGWGIINIKAAADIVKRYAENPATRVVLEDTLSSSQTWTQTYTSDGTTPVRVTLAWIDPAGTGQTSSTTDRTPRLVNNLNLRVIQGGTTYMPYVMPFVTGGHNTSDYGTAATTGDNTTDNVEQVTIAAPPAGTYTVQVTHSGSLQSGDAQPFSLAVTGMAASAAPAPALTSLSPEQGDGTDNFVLTVNGSDFLLGSDVILRRAGSADVKAYGIIPVANKITCRVDTSSLTKGYWDVVLRAPNGTETTLANAFLLPNRNPSTETTIYSNDFESGATGLTLDDGWSVASPNKGAVSGPATGYESTNALVTYPGENYLNGKWIDATIPIGSTLGYASITLTYKRWVGLLKTGSGRETTNDYGYVYYLDDEDNWFEVSSVEDTIETGWTTQTVTLPEGAIGQDNLKILFELGTDYADVSFGWNIDDIKVTVTTLGSVLIPPTFTSTAPTTATAGQAFSYSITTADTDTAGASRTLAASGLPAWMTFTNNGDGTATLSGTPSASGSATITLSVTDGSYTTYQILDLAILPVGGNTAPVISTATLPDANVDVAYSATLNATDADGHSLTLSVGSKPSWLTFTDNGDGTATLGGTPTAGANGSFDLTFTATDGFQPVQKTLTLTVRPRAVVGFSSSTYSPAETSGNLTVTVNRAGNSLGAVAVNYATTNGTATSGSDYTATSGTLNWADGDNADKTFTVPILDDEATEGSETFTLTLSSLTGIADLGTTPATVTISDDENNTAPVVTITSPPSTINLPERNNALALVASVTDDAKPTWGSLTTTWSQVSGPSGQTATFAAASSASTSVTFPADGTYTLRITGSDGEFSATKDVTIMVGTVTGPVAGTGITREVYSSISGSAVSDLTSNSKFTGNTPDSTSTITDFFEAPTNAADNYGQRMRGYFIPSQTGNHTFVIASDDTSELWLSTDSDAANKVKIAQVNAWTNSREWTKESNQTSAAISLTSGQAYYIEALMKEGSGGDNLAVGVTMPDDTEEKPITAARLAAWGSAPSNAAPQVNPGTAPAAVVGTAATLSGTSSDDGLPAASTLTTTWSKISGAGTVTFDNANAANTTATFSAAGSYVLRLTATDGSATVFQEISVTVTDSFAGWISGYSVGTKTAATDDPDGDGLANLLEYALGTAPDSSASRPNLTSQISDLKLQLTFTPQRSDVTYTIEASSDLSDWSNQTVLTGLTLGTPYTYTDTVALGGTTTKRFLRLKVSQP
jgi:hypothetical protein